MLPCRVYLLYSVQQFSCFFRFFFACWLTPVLLINRIDQFHFHNDELVFPQFFTFFPSQSSAFWFKLHSNEKHISMTHANPSGFSCLKPSEKLNYDVVRGDEELGWARGFGMWTPRCGSAAVGEGGGNESERERVRVEVYVCVRMRAFSGYRGTRRRFPTWGTRVFHVKVIPLSPLSQCIHFIPLRKLFLLTRGVEKSGSRLKES